MAVILTADEMSRARKIAAMLSASTDGERLNALSMLQKIADAKKVRIDELLLALGGGGNSSNSSNSRPQPKPRPWNDPRDEAWWNEQFRKGGAHAEGGDYSYTDRSNPEADRAFAEALKRQHEAKQKARREQQERDRKLAEDIMRAKQQGTSNALRQRLDALQSIPESRLSPWEVDFRYSVLDKALSPFWTPSEKQNTIINKIIEKAL